MLPNRGFSFAWLACAALVSAADPSPSALETAGGLRVGLVTLNLAESSVSFPGQVNMREETVEYAVVHKTGKTHESIFRTETSARDIHTAVLLLGAKPGTTNQFGPDGKALPLGPPVTLEVAWTNRQGVVRHALEDLVLDRQTTNSIARGSWIYNGSNFSEGAFTAERDGSIISIHSDAGALINNPRPGRTNDDLHVPFAARLPTNGTPVVITVRLSRGE